MQHVVLLDVTQVGVLIFYLLKQNLIIKKQKYRGKHPDILFCLDDFLKKNKLKLDNVSALGCLEGQGSFSGARQAAAVLNTIFLVKKKPVFNLDVRLHITLEDQIEEIKKIIKKKFGWIYPIYSGDPNITLSGKKK